MAGFLFYLQPSVNYTSGRLDETCQKEQSLYQNYTPCTAGYQVLVLY